MLIDISMPKEFGRLFRSIIPYGEALQEIAWKILLPIYIYICLKAYCCLTSGLDLLLLFLQVDALTTKRGKEGGWVVERLLNQV